MLYYASFFCFYFFYLFKLNYIRKEKDILNLVAGTAEERWKNQAERCVSYFLLMWHNVCVYIMKFTLLFLSYVLVI